MGKKETEAVAERLARIPYDEERVLLGTGKFALATMLPAIQSGQNGTVAAIASRSHARTCAISRRCARRRCRRWWRTR